MLAGSMETDLREFDLNGNMVKWEFDLKIILDQSTVSKKKIWNFI